MADNSDNKKRLLEALEIHLGVVTDACKAANISRDTHYRWLKEDSEYKTKVDSISDVALDFAESKLHNNIKTGDTTAIIFYLKTKGKKRGYIERTEIEDKTEHKSMISIKPHEGIRSTSN